MSVEKPSLSPTALRRELGVFGATMMGLGSIIGTGVFVSIGVAADVAGPAVVLVLSGIRRSSFANVMIVSVTLLALLYFCVAGAPVAFSAGLENFRPFFAGSAEDTGALRSLLHAAALMFVAFTGYGRIATLGEEVHDPRQTIPRAIVMTLFVSAGLYIAVAAIGIGAVGAVQMAEATHEQAAPLQVIARGFPPPGGHWLIAIGAVTAMVGVLLNLILGLSRVLLAMGRRGDMPRWLGRLDRTETSPTAAVVVVGLGIATFAAVGNVRLTWSFSAFTVLIYYAVTNLAALYLPRSERLYSRLYAVGGLAACLFLAFWVDREVWLSGLLVLAAGLVWHALARLRARRRQS